MATPNADDPRMEAWRAQTGGSVEEYLVFSDLQRRGLTPGVDFYFQADRFGGLDHIGNAKIHFTISMLKLAIRVQGQRWEKLSRSQKANDVIQKLIWEGRGWFVADMLSEEIDQNVRRVVSLALSFKDTPKAEAALQ